MARRVLPAFALTLLLASPAAGAGTEEVLRCLDLADPTARLACFDRTVPGLRALPPTGTSATAEPAAPVLTPEQRFGLPPAEIRRQEPEASLETIAAKVTSAKELVPGRFLVVLDNDQIWLVKEAGRVRLAAGDAVEVRRGAIGGYTMVPEKVRTLLRAERVR